MNYNDTDWFEGELPLKFNPGASMMIRPPAVAGMFYPRQADTCRAELQACIDRASDKPHAPASVGRIVGGVVPHAGWVCSGATASHVFTEIAHHQPPAVAIVFGAIHVQLPGPQSYLYPFGAWQTPLGLANIDEDLAERLAHSSLNLTSNPLAHEREHSIEVEVPFIQHLLPQTRLVPIMVPVNQDAAALGDAIGRICHRDGIDAVFLASTDLTHYGPAYGFSPMGVGADGLRWAKEVNDRRIIDLMLAMRASEVVPEAVVHHNACGAGAIAATIAACKAMGASRAVELEHTTSYEVLRDRFDEPMRDAVGYTAIIFHE